MKRVLFLGEGDLSGPARYLASVLHWAGLPFDHRPDQAKIPKTWRTPGRYSVVVLSDYRYSSFTPCAREWLTSEVKSHGAGFLMIGGWASFTGLVGGYAGTDLATLLPVHCVPHDDRVNCASGSVVVIKDDRRQSLPIVCGYHRAIPKPGTRTLMELRDLTFKAGRPTLGKAHPLLVMGTAGAGRTAAFLTDCAPHWAGGLVDWGRRRVTVKLSSSVSTEVGDQYLAFFTRLLHTLGAK